MISINSGHSFPADTESSFMLDSPSWRSTLVFHSLRSHLNLLTFPWLFAFHGLISQSKYLWFPYRVSATWSDSWSRPLHLEWGLALVCQDSFWFFVKSLARHLDFIEGSSLLDLLLLFILLFRDFAPTAAVCEDANESSNTRNYQENIHSPLLFARRFYEYLLDLNFNLFDKNVSRFNDDFKRECSQPNRYFESGLWATRIHAASKGHPELISRRFILEPVSWGKANVNSVPSGLKVSSITDSHLDIEEIFEGHIPVVCVIGLIKILVVHEYLIVAQGLVLEQPVFDFDCKSIPILRVHLKLGGASTTVTTCIGAGKWVHGGSTVWSARAEDLRAPTSSTTYFTFVAAERVTVVESGSAGHLALSNAWAAINCVVHLVDATT